MLATQLRNTTNRRFPCAHPFPPTLFVFWSSSFGRLTLRIPFIYYYASHPGSSTIFSSVAFSLFSAPAFLTFLLPVYALYLFARVLIITPNLASSYRSGGPGLIPDLAFLCSIGPLHSSVFEHPHFSNLVSQQRAFLFLHMPPPVVGYAPGLISLFSSHRSPPPPALHFISSSSPCTHPPRSLP